MAFEEWQDDKLIISDEPYYTSPWYNIRDEKPKKDYSKTDKSEEKLDKANQNLQKWDLWYQSAVPYLQAQNHYNPQYNSHIENFRQDAVEWLTYTVFQGDYASAYPLEMQISLKQERYRWLFQTLMEAHHVYPDIITYFLKDLKRRDNDEALHNLVLEDLNKLLQNPPPFVDPNLIRAMQIYHEPVNDDRRVSDDVSYQWIKLLDDPALVVAAAAAYCLGDRSNLFYTSQQKLIDIITQKELERPGIAGAFFTTQYFDDIFLSINENGEKRSHVDRERKIAEWMMDLMERRKGKPEIAPEHIALCLDISFYLHEICDFMPDMVERMMKNGFDDLAVMTATEQADRIDGMEKPLKVLTENENPRIAKEAKDHLEKFYQ